MAHQIRPAKETDLEQIHEIFSHYVVNTFTSFYHYSPPLSTIKSKFVTAVNKDFPYLVAVAATVDDNSIVQTVGLESASVTPDAPSQRILGYAYASPFRGPLLSYAPSVEISIFINPSDLRTGIGSKLMIDLLEKLTTTIHHAVEPGHESKGQDFRIRNVFAIMAHDVNGPEPASGEISGEALSQWYQSFGFEVVGRLKGVGFKGGRWVDTVYLQLDLEKWSLRHEKGSTDATAEIR